jgi:hypothetical protein
MGATLFFTSSRKRLGIGIWYEFGTVRCKINT